MTDAYQFHQTPADLAKDLLKFVPIQPGEKLYEPFKGEGAFFDNFPADNPKDWSEIEQGRDYKDFKGEYDWVITNPPFRLEDETGRRVNSFWYLLDFYSKSAKKGIAFLGNDRCFCTLTPKRQEILKSRGFVLTKVVVCNVKKWRGRYFFFVLERGDTSNFTYLRDTY